MQKINKESGITLISLVITIIVISILATVTIGLGGININNSQDEQYQSELYIVQQAVMEQYTKAQALNELIKLPNSDDSNKPSVFIGERLQSTSYIDTTNTTTNISWVMISPKYYEDFYYRLNKSDLSELGITNTDDEYIVNYKTGEVYNETEQITSFNENLYITSLKQPLDSSSTIDDTFASD